LKLNVHSHFVCANLYPVCAMEFFVTKYKHVQLWLATCFLGPCKYILVMVLFCQRVQA